MIQRIFKKYKINTLVSISILNIKGSIDDTVLEKVKEKYEGKCMKEGLVRKDSIKILKRSAGKSMKEHFNSSYYYYAQCIAEICNPDYDSLIKCTIVNSNNAGYIGHVNDQGSTIIHVVIPRLTAGIQHEKSIDDIKENDEVLIRVIGKKINLFDTNMTIIGSVMKDESDIQNEKVVETDEINSGTLEINDTGDDDNDNDNDNDNENDDDLNSEYSRSFSANDDIQSEVNSVDDDIIDLDENVDDDLDKNENDENDDNEGDDNDDIDDDNDDEIYDDQ